MAALNLPARTRSHAFSYRLRALYSSWYEELEGSPVRCGAVATGAAMVFGVGALPGAPPPRAGTKSLNFNRSSSLINPLRASCSLPGKARGPGGSLLRGPRYNHAERFRSSERSEGFGLLVLTAHPQHRLRQSALAREFSSTMLNECLSLRASARSLPAHLILSRICRFNGPALTP